MPATIDTRKKISAHFRIVIARSSKPLRRRIDGTLKSLG
jgi:hypothetical protein